MKVSERIEKIMKKIIVSLLMLMFVFASVAYALPVPIVHSVSTDILASVTVKEVFNLTITPTEIRFGTVAMGDTSTVEMTTTGESNIGRHFILEIKGTDFVNHPNIIKVSTVTMENTLVSGEGSVVKNITMDQNYQKFAESLGNPTKYIKLIIGSGYTIKVPETLSGTYTSLFTITMTE